MLEDSALVAFAASTDLGRSRTFYGEVLGLALREQNEYAAVFEANGAILRVTKVEQLAPAGYTVLGWIVPDIEASARQLSAKGVTFQRYESLLQDELGIWTTPDGSRVAWFNDPDGNTLSLTQLA